MEVLTPDTLRADDIVFVQDALTKMAPAFARRLAPIYKALDWHWQTDGMNALRTGFIPDEAAILETLLVLISTMSSQVGKQNVGGMTGGLSVWATTEDQGGACAYGIEMTIQTKYKERSLAERFEVKL